MSRTADETQAYQDYIQRLANNLISEARRRGFVLRIDLVPCAPLAMGNYKMVSDVRPAREAA